MIKSDGFSMRCTVKLSVISLGTNFYNFTYKNGKNMNYIRKLHITYGLDELSQPTGNLLCFILKNIER